MNPQDTTEAQELHARIAYCDATINMTGLEAFYAMRDARAQSGDNLYSFTYNMPLDTDMAKEHCKLAKDCAMNRLAIL